MTLKELLERCDFRDIATFVNAALANEHYEIVREAFVLYL